MLVDMAKPPGRVSIRFIDQREQRRKAALTGTAADRYTARSLPDHTDARRQLERQPAAPSVRVWDLPVRLFHWVIVALIVLSFVTGHVGGNAMRIHELSGFSILTLVLFRVLWGFFGSTHARFGDFVRGLAAARSYAAVLWSGRSAALYRA